MELPRSRTQIEEALREGFIEAGAPLYDFSESSHLSYFIRSLASSQGEVDRLLVQYRRDSFLPTASGQALDRHAVGLTREGTTGQTAAQGKVLAKALDDGTETVPEGTLLVDLEDGRRFATTESASVAADMETVISVIAVSPGEAGNKSPGTELFAEAFPQVQFLIGEQRTASGEVEGALTGGRDRESDEAFRARIMASRASPMTNNRAKMRQYLLGLDGINNALVSTPLPGTVEVWIDAGQTLSEATLSSYKETLSQYIPPGVVLAVKQGTRKPISFEVAISAVALEELPDTIAQIKAVISQSVAELGFNEDLILSHVQELVRAIDPEATVAYPQSDVVVARGEIAVVESIVVVNYESRY